MDRILIALCCDVVVVSPTLNVGLITAIVPDAAPMDIAVAAPNAFTVVAVLFHSATVVRPLPTVSADSVIVAPEPAPIVSVVAAPAN